MVRKISMSNAESVLGTCVFALILTEVTTWTIDLPEVRKFYFERNEYKHGDENKIHLNGKPPLVNYNNIGESSLHNNPYSNRAVNGGRYVDNGIYANDYGYHTYMEKKVHGIFHKGTVYLEGLQRAMERYSELLENCGRLERSRPPTNRSWVPESEPPQRPLTAEETAGVRCAKATRETDHVWRLASLVIWATEELQDIADAKDDDKEAKQSDEDILLLQLAWALDELARLTGYEPDASQITTIPTPAPTPTTASASFPNLPIRNGGPATADCVKDRHSAASAVTAAVRCAVPLPALVLQFLNITDKSPPTAKTTLEMMRLLTMFNNSESGGGGQAFARMPPEQVRLQMLRCLADDAKADPAACLGFAAFVQFLNDTSSQKQQLQNIQLRNQRETDSSQLEILEAAEDHSVGVVPIRKSRAKRASDNPLANFSKFYIKYKTWSSSNPVADGSTDGTSAADSFDVKNDLTAVKSIRKRSVNVEDGITVRFPEDSMQDLSNYANRKPGVHFDKHALQTEKIKAQMVKMFRGSGATAKERVLRLKHMTGSVHKKSVHHVRSHRPRVPQDRMQDTSYYVKAKAARSVRPHVLSARGNVAVVRRYVAGAQPLVVGA